MYIKVSRQGKLCLSKIIRGDKMDIIQSETNRGKKSLLFDDTYRLSNILDVPKTKVAKSESQQMRTAKLL